MMERQFPLVSVGLPIYNRPEGLRRTLECFVNQTYENIEIIIADNCSPDPEVEKIAREYLAKDSRISYFRHDENKGWGFNTNFVIEKAKGDYFLRATDDDWWDAVYIEKIMSLMLKNEDAELGFSNFIEVDVQGNKSRIHIDNHLPLLMDFTSPNRVKNCEKFIKQFEGFGKSCLYFSIFKTEILRLNFVKNTLKNEMLAGDLLIVFFCLLKGQLVIVPEVLMKVTFGNEKLYDGPIVENKVRDFLFFTFDTKGYQSVKNTWQAYFKSYFVLVAECNLSLISKMVLKLAILRRIVLFNYDLICVNTNTRFYNIFYRLRRKYYLE